MLRGKLRGIPQPDGGDEDPRGRDGLRGKAEGLLRQALAKAGVDVPMVVNLKLNKYFEGRGQKKLVYQLRKE